MLYIFTMSHNCWHLFDLNINQLLGEIIILFTDIFQDLINYYLIYISILDATTRVTIFLVTWYIFCPDLTSTHSDVLISDRTWLMFNRKSRQPSCKRFSWQMYYVYINLFFQRHYPQQIPHRHLQHSLYI